MDMDYRQFVASLRAVVEKLQAKVADLEAETEGEQNDEDPAAHDSAVSAEDKDLDVHGARADRANPDLQPSPEGPVESESQAASSGTAGADSGVPRARGDEEMALILEATLGRFDSLFKTITSSRKEKTQLLHEVKELKKDNAALVAENQELKNRLNDREDSPDSMVSSDEVIGEQN